MKPAAPATTIRKCPSKSLFYGNLRRYPHAKFRTVMAHVSGVESALLAVLMALSMGLFVWRLRQRGATPYKGRARAPDFELRPLAPRVRQFMWEVMAQGKVIANGRSPGLAHAFVFWGFCAFALVTVNHLAEGFGWRFLDRRRAASGGSISDS